jgi:hypothetical protein
MLHLHRNQAQRFVVYHRPEKKASMNAKSLDLAMPANNKRGNFILRKDLFT